MSRQRYGRVVIRVAILAGVALCGAGTLLAVGGHTARVKQNLTPTTMAPNARGKARLIVRSSSRGKFAVVAKHLTGNKQYDVIVGGVKVGEMQTTAGGSGRALFKTQPGARDSLLGFDPRGSHVMIRDAEDGDDELVGDMPDDDPSEVACCLPDDEDGETECEEMTPDACTAAGGTPIGVPGGTAGATCLPNPCDGGPSPEPIVCCTNESHDEESESECEQVESERDCAEHGGLVVSATSCEPNPCEGTPSGDAAPCCLTESHEGETEAECRVISAEACSASGGSPAGVASCHPDPCGGGDDGGDEQDD